MALVESSKAPLLLLDDDVVVVGASASFCNTFNLDPATIANRRLADLGAGEWDVPQLNSLLRATIGGAAEIDAYEMDLVREGKATCRLILSAHKLDYFDTEKVRVVLAATDITPTRLAEKQKDDLVREKQVLLQELQHRVANSLQIIASVLMQSAKRVQSDETRLHLQDAHSRVMSIAMLQKQLAVTQLKSVELKTYFSDLCRSIAASMIDDPNRITLEAVVDSTSTNSDVSVSMGLIVTELVINAIKHAFLHQTTGGKIIVSFNSDEGAWLLSVTDNGSGMPVGKKQAKAGLGTGIVEALAKQLDATVAVIDANPGTRVEVRRGQPRQ
ncbi:sensor histidine kinase [Sphingomonas sp. RB56-2]|uniref:histidine kinase n=1 Tax=Sphingomonas brevis TaxID=2908206 RepID=A0ABT0SBS2_9SPHN|nr:sensor histidine kinase [Sphingomonas brevis]MCL6741807.1 sensor histidine kinase [Sphingomonas brevis]